MKKVHSFRHSWRSQRWWLNIVRFRPSIDIYECQFLFIRNFSTKGRHNTTFKIRIVTFRGALKRHLKHYLRLVINRGLIISLIGGSQFSEMCAWLTVSIRTHKQFQQQIGPLCLIWLRLHYISAIIEHEEKWISWKCIAYISKFWSLKQRYFNYFHSWRWFLRFKIG